MADPKNPNQPTQPIQPAHPPVQPKPSVQPMQPEPFVQGKNPDGTPMVDADGTPVDKNGNRDPRGSGFSPKP